MHIKVRYADRKDSLFFDQSRGIGVKILSLNATLKRDSGVVDHKKDVVFNSWIFN